MSSKRSCKLVTSALRQQRTFSVTAIARNNLFTPALPKGENPAYDAALAYISSKQSRSISKFDALKASLPEAPSVEQLQQLDKAEIEAYSYDPSIRRTFRETGGKGHMHQRVMRWLGEQQWEKEGGLDLLMQRVLQMNVFPDLLPNVPPTAPLSISVGPHPVIPGTFQRPSSFAQPPEITHQLYHHPFLPTPSNPNPSALHTLLVIDPDAPNHETHSYQERLLYLKTDIPISVLDGEVNMTDSSVGKEVISWEPPAPEQGTPYHRYVFLMFRQQSPSEITPPSREAFNLRQFISTQGISSDALTGISLFRAEWDQSEDHFINQVFRESRGVAGGAPIYRKIAKEVRYGYPMTAKQRQREDVREAIWAKAVSEMESLGDQPVDQTAA